MVRCGMKWLVVLKELLKKYLENLKNVGDQLWRLGSGIRMFKQQLD
jgi:hypothetical protein